MAATVIRRGSEATVTTSTGVFLVAANGAVTQEDGGAVDGADISVVVLALSNNGFDTLATRVMKRRRS